MIRQAVACCAAGPGPAALLRGDCSRGAGVPLGQGSCQLQKGFLMSHLPLYTPDFFSGPLPQPGLAGRRHGEQQRGDPARPQAGEVPTAPARELRALPQIRLLRWVCPGWGGAPGFGEQGPQNTKQKDQDAQFSLNLTQTALYVV